VRWWRKDPPAAEQTKAPRAPRTKQRAERLRRLQLARLTGMPPHALQANTTRGHGLSWALRAPSGWGEE
jgi:hypothetical protein